MIPNLQPNTTYAVHLRAPSVSGGKEWVGSVTATGEIHTYWGRTNQINQHAAKPGDLTVLNKIIDQKQNGKDRYARIDMYTQKDGWTSQRKQQKTAAPAQNKSPVPPVKALVTVADCAAEWSTEAPDDSIKWDF